MPLLMTPALDELIDLMRTHRVAGDPLDVAALVLSLYRERHPAAKPETLQQWVEQLAIDTVHTRAGEREQSNR